MSGLKAAGHGSGGHGSRGHGAEAIVLRTWPIREADLIVSLFTREAGKVKGVARSAAKSRRRFGGALEPMTHVRAQYVTRPRQELVRLDSLEILHSPLAEPTDYARAAALAFYTEVLDEMLPEDMLLDHGPQDAAFRLLLGVLEQTRVGTVWMPVTYFALWMLRLMGWMPDMRRCTACQRPFSQFIQDEPVYWQVQGDGLFCAEHRQSGASPAAGVLSPGSRALAERLFHAPPEEFAGEPWPRSRAADLRRFAMQALERHGEQRLQSVGALLRLGG